MPPWLASRMVALGTRDRRERRPPLRAAGAPLAAERSVLVPGPRLGDGHGLALVRHHDVGDGRAQEGPQPAGATSSASTSAAAAASSRAARPTSCATIADRIGLDGEALVRTSRLTARIDNNAIADGFQIYLHSFVVTADGEWAVVQQGMNEASAAGAPLSLALGRRSATSPPIRTRPSSASTRARSGTWSIGRARPAQDALLAIAREDPDRTLADVRRLEMPAHHDVRAGRRAARGGWARCWRSRTSATCATSPSFLLLEQLGPRTLQSLALVAEVVHGTPTRFDDPARFSFAHGGKDGHPVPGAAARLRRVDRRAATRARRGEARTLREAGRLQAARRVHARHRDQAQSGGRRRAPRSRTSARSRRRSAAARCSTIGRVARRSTRRAADSCRCSTRELFHRSACES